MFDWLFEGRTSVYVILGALAVVLLIAWWQNRWGWCLVAVGVLLVLIGLYWLLDRLVETDREQIKRKVQEMAAAVRKGKLDDAFVHFSDQFILPEKKLTKPEFLRAAEIAKARWNITDLVVWDFEFPERPEREKGTVKGSFQCKAKGDFGGESIPFRCEYVFAYEPPHGWRLKSFGLFNPMTTEKYPIPGI